MDWDWPIPHPSLTSPSALRTFFKTIFRLSAPHLRPHSLLAQFIKKPVHTLSSSRSICHGAFSMAGVWPAFSEDPIMHIRRPPRPRYWSIHQTFIHCRLSRASIAAMPPAFLRRRDLPEGVGPEKNYGNPKASGRLCRFSEKRKKKKNVFSFCAALLAGEPLL